VDGDAGLGKATAKLNEGRLPGEPAGQGGSRMAVRPPIPQLGGRGRHPARVGKGSEAWLHDVSTGRFDRRVCIAPCLKPADFPAVLGKEGTS
jgi:hypothetical protein